jgi:1,4-alpha-glucan branching enzyme
MSILIPTTFKFPGGLAPGGRRVAVVGSFNGWNANAHPLVRTPDGDWMITVYLPATRIVYGFDVDGAFWLDPFDEGRLPNGWGSEYSVRSVGSGLICDRRRSPATVGAWGVNPAPGDRERAMQAEGVGR